MFRLNYVNKYGIPALENTSQSLTDSSLTYNFNRHPYVGFNFQGLFVVKITGTPEAPTDAVPIYFNTPTIAGTNSQIYDQSGTAYTTATWPGDGIYLVWYDRTTNEVRLLTS